MHRTMILKPLNSTILRTRGSISCMKAHERMHTPESALALARTRGHSGVRGYHNGRYRKQESEGKPPPSLLNFAVAAATCLVASSVPVFCAAADAADGKTAKSSATAVRGSPGLPDAETPLLASECIRRLKTILDVVRGIYGIPQPQPGAPPPLPPLPSPVIHGAPRLMTPQVRLWNRAAFQTSGDNHDDNTELGYEVVLDAQYASTNSIYDANWISKSGKGSSSAGSESAGPAVSLTAALGLLARAYPKLAASISRGEGAGTAGIWQYRPRPNLLIVLRPTHSGQAVEISWKPCACDDIDGDGKTASTPQQRTVRSTQKGEAEAASEQQAAAAEQQALGLLGIDLEAIAMLYGAAAQDWSMSASQSAGTAATGKPEATPADTLDKLVEIARAVHSMSATAKPVVDPGAVPSAATASASASSKSNGPRTVLRIIKPKGSASSSSGDKTTVDVDADEEEDEDEEAAAVSRGAGGIGSLFGSRGSGLDPKTQPLKVLKSLGIKYYSKKSHVMEGIDWECLAGYEDIRRDVEDNVLLPMQHPDMYAIITEKTRARPEPNTAGAYIFLGPPGTGKTTTARIIASQTERPLIVLNFENIGSPFYSSSEGNFAKVLESVSNVKNAILFIDEADSMFPSRYGGDAIGGGGAGGPGARGTTADIGNKLLAQMLKFLEGMGGQADHSVIFASNRADQLDPALLSRCASSVTFDLPDDAQRAAIWKRYAKHLKSEEIERLVQESEGFSGRDVKRVCEVAERRHCAALQRAGVLPPPPSQSSGEPKEPNISGGSSASAMRDKITPPSITEYVDATEERWEGVLSIGGPPSHGVGRHRSSPPSPDSFGSGGGRAGGRKRGGRAGDRGGQVPIYRSQKQAQEQGRPMNQVGGKTSSSSASGPSSTGSGSCSNDHKDPAATYPSQSHPEASSSSSSSSPQPAAAASASASQASGLDRIPRSRQAPPSSSSSRHQVPKDIDV